MLLLNKWSVFRPGPVAQYCPAAVRKQRLQGLHLLLHQPPSLRISPCTTLTQIKLSIPKMSVQYNLERTVSALSCASDTGVHGLGPELPSIIHAPVAWSLRWYVQVEEMASSDFR